MWVTKFEIKKLFSKIYKSVNKVYESIYYDIGALINPIILVGSNGIGGGNFGSYIDIQGKITNNTILDIVSASKDESLKIDATHIMSRSNNGFTSSVKTTVIPSCYSVIIDLWYFFPSNRGVSTYGGIYIVVKYNGSILWDTRNITTMALGGENTRYHYVDSYMTSDKGFWRAFPQAPDYWNSYIQTNLRREFSFEKSGNVEVLFYLDFSGGWEYDSSKLQGVANVTSLKATNDITRDIYATVIEQVNPAI